MKRFCKDKLRQTSQRNINVRKQRNFNGRDIISGYELLLSTLNSFIVGTEVYYPRCYYINDGESLQILYQDCTIILCLEVANHKCWLILLRLFIILNLVLCIVERKIPNYTYLLHSLNLQRDYKLFRKTHRSIKNQDHSARHEKRHP